MLRKILPNEKNNVADQHPDIVKQLKERIEYYKSTHIAQLDPRIDSKSSLSFQILMVYGLIDKQRFLIQNSSYLMLLLIDSV